MEGTNNQPVGETKQQEESVPDNLKIDISRVGNTFQITLQVLSEKQGTEADIFINDPLNPEPDKKMLEARTDGKGFYSLTIKVEEKLRKIIFGVKGSSVSRQRDFYPSAKTVRVKAERKY